MAVCSACGSEMMDAVGCTKETYSDFEDGVERSRINYGDETRQGAGDPCRDCGAPKGELHHPGCELEECPRCGGQAMACGCAG